MSINDILRESEEGFERTKEYLGSLSESQRDEIKEKEIIEKVKKNLEKIKLSYIDDKEWFRYYGKNNEELRDGTTKEVYIIDFKTQDIEMEEGFLEGQVVTCYIDVETEEILYYRGLWGDIEADRSIE